MVPVTPDDWPGRLPMAVAQLRRGALEAPWPQASWSSVVRRSAVVVGFVVAGIVTGHLSVVVFAAFGALQVGLGEAILPFRRLLRLVVVVSVSMCAVAFVAMWLGGTWWTVPLLGAVAFAQAATAAEGVVARTAGISALAMGVIFAGLDADPVQATTWLAIGAATQSVIWLVFWRRERDLSIRLALANTIRTLMSMSRHRRISGRDSNRASAEIDALRHTIQESGIPNRSGALAVAGAVNEVRRTLVAWRTLEQPGYAERLTIVRRLHCAVRRLSEGPSPAVPGQGIGRVWAVGRQLDVDLTAVDRAIDDVAVRDHPPVPAQRPPSFSWGWLRPGTERFRQGARMAVALAIAQALSLIAPIDHSFWIPLTCVFVVKPDWAFTLVRSTARVGGNLLAVVLVPLALTGVVGHAVAVAALVAIISAVAFRFFTANYILASFGVAGTILVLDQSVAPGESLYTSRIVATLIGAAVALVVSMLLPTFRSGEAVRLLADVVGGLGAWSAAVTDAVTRPGSLDDAGLVRIGEQERNNLLRLRPAVEAALLEPRPATDPRCLAVALDSAERAHLCLLALTFQARHAEQNGGPGLDIGADARAVGEEFQRAADALHGAPVPTTGPAAGSPPRSDEERAVALETVRLRQAATDLADATGWVTAAART